MGGLLEVEVVRTAPAGVRSVVGVFAGRSPAAAELPEEIRSAVAAARAHQGWRGAEEQVLELTTRSGRTVQVRGLGEASAFDARKLHGLLERAVEGARAAAARRLALYLPDHPASVGEQAAARATREAALLGYRYDRFLSRPEKSPLRALLLVPTRASLAAWRAGAETGRAIAAGVAWARELANTPPNVATPAWMAEQARSWAKRHRARFTVLGPAQLRRRGMGGLLAVGGGSAHPPRLVRIELGRGPRTVALVGKGVTFDTGGISIKPAAQMDEMKWDKCGACAVLGALEAVARLRLPLRLRAYLPLAENMPDGTAYRPGDIVRCANGKTVEILNTDAEGRMILADALAWAASEKPDELVELSTLTGACVVALGPTGAGLFSPHDGLAAALLEAAEAAGERLWRLPLWSEFLDEMRGAHADLRNSGGRWGGASAAAAFLSQFVGATERWAHLDIAGPAYVGEGKAKRGATGYGVALTVGWLGRSGARRRR